MVTTVISFGPLLYGYYWMFRVADTIPEVLLVLLIIPYLWVVQRVAVPVVARVFFGRYKGKHMGVR